jgi:hypothetical protein
MTSSETDPVAAGACSLPNDELRNRLAWIRSEILPHATRSERLENGRAWEFGRSPDVRAKLERLVELERACCSGLHFDLEDGPASLRLTVEGIDPGWNPTG